MVAREIYVYPGQAVRQDIWIIINALVTGGKDSIKIQTAVLFGTTMNTAATAALLATVFQGRVTSQHHSQPLVMFTWATAFTQLSAFTTQAMPEAM
jgi:hypothetical protein